MCDNEAARSIGTAWSSALARQASGADMNQLVATLRGAADSAPEAIRADFKTLVDAQAPFFELVGRAGASGNYAVLGQDPAFQQIISRLGSPEVVAATGRINAWFVQNCPAPR